MTQPVDLTAALACFEEPWSPRTVAVLNDNDIRVVKTKGEFDTAALKPTRCSSS